MANAVEVVLRDGCTTHAIPAEQIQEWWLIAGDRDATVSVCLCCGGPSPSGMKQCKKCDNGTPASIWA